MKTIDMHTHLWQGSYERDKKNLLCAMEDYEIDKIYVSGLSHLGNPLPEMVDEVNQQVELFIREHPDCVGGYVYVSPELPNAMEVLRRGIEDQRMEGVKLWLSTYCDDVHVNPVIERAIQYKVPVLLHAFHKVGERLTNESTGEHVAKLARRYPEAKLIMAHLGGNCYHGIPAIADCPNVWVDYSGSLFRGDELSYSLELLGADRILHGSDMPGVYLPNVGLALEETVSEADREKILYKNTEKLFDRNFSLKKGWARV